MHFLAAIYIISTSTMSYSDAINSLFNDHQSKSKVEIEKAAARRTRTIADMREYLRRIELGSMSEVGQELRNIKRILHVSGTKGKGSTCAICESLLRNHGLRTGLFTSPHLIDVRERIRINGRIVSKEVFAGAYWTVRSRLESYANIEAQDSDDLPILPGYFRMLVLVAVFIFANYQDPIDVLILEVGMGGRYDATNIFDADAFQTVSGITVIDYDHVRVLGSTLEQIAWEKGGIFQREKGGARVSERPDHKKDDDNKMNQSQGDQPDSGSFTYYALGTNPESVLEVFRTCAAVEGHGGKLVTVSEPISASYELGLPGSHQRWNAELAQKLSEEILGGPLEEAKLRKGLKEVTWPARCQTVEYNGVYFRIDGAHTVQSISVGLEWFENAAEVFRNADCVLCFNCSHERQPVELLQLLVRVPFSRVYFCKSDSERPSSVAKPKAKDLLSICTSTNVPESTWQDTLAIIWKNLSNHEVNIHSNITAREVVEKEICKGTQVFVTGSLYLAGSFLTAVDWSEASDEGVLVSSLERI